VDDIVAIDDIVDAGAKYKPTYYISNKIGDPKRVPSAWDFFEDLCATQHAHVKNHKNLKMCLACRRNDKDNLISMGVGHRKTSTSAKLVSHLQQAHLGDGRYKAYLAKEVERKANKSKLEIASEANQPSMAAFVPDNKEVVI
jgi:hypothetical protein